MSVVFRIAGVLQTMNRLSNMVDQIRAEAPAAVDDVAMQARDQIRALAPKDRPFYYTTIDVHTVSAGGDEIEKRIGTSEPFGRRLEHGYFGTDSLGRTYAQEGQPHFGPVADTIGATFSSVVGRLSRSGPL